MYQLRRRVQRHNLSRVYCNGINATGPLTLTAGVYILSGGGFDVGGGGSGDPYLSGGLCTSPTGKNYVNATGGVTIYLGPGTSNNAIQVSSCIAITAPTTGNTAGIAFWVDKNAPSNGKEQFNGGANMAITGALYAPSEEVDYTGSSTVTSTCTQIVANNIVFSGGNGDTLESDCAGTGVSQPAGSSTGTPQLVE